MKKCLLLLFVLTGGYAMAQSGDTDTAWKKTYRAFATKTNDLVHTKLDAKFDYSKSYLNGKVWITLKPHFYPTDSLQLDAKGMNINKVEILKAGKYIPLKYTYDSMFLNIKLDKTYLRDERYEVYIDYTAKPDEFRTEGSAAITDAKGLYFINPKGEDKNKPTQIWTQGETEASSVWIPTIDKPNQKTTNEFSLTVPDKYVTLSNGKLTTQKKNADGTRTDTWVMDLPHSPYLFFMGVGDFAIVKDSYKGKEVNYYVEKEYEKVARKIFGLTPEMMKFFSEKVTGIEYPWNKYSQIVGRDYVSGAMENTTATLHQESAQQNARELVDGVGWESTIAHELFHQWFGDLVTAESWSNITVNESFADYSQFLWFEYKYGADEAAFENFNSMQTYFFSRPADATKDLVRFYYKDKEDVFDNVSYPKGGRILNMLRNYVGDDAFFKSLNKYLTTNKFGNGSAHKLRLAFEDVTGKDLNWFFNQWYFGSGHPKLDISYGYDAGKKISTVYLKQTQTGNKLFKLPITIDVYNGAAKKSYHVWAENRTDTFSFPVSSKPDLINVDPDRVILAEKKDDKTLAEYIHGFTYAGKYLDRREALEFAAKKLSDPAAYNLLVKGLSDPYFRIRSRAIINLDMKKVDAATISKLESIAKTDDHTLTRATAIDALAKLKNVAYKDFFAKSTRDSSYSIAGAALDALALIDGQQAFAIVNQISKEENRGRLANAIANTTIKFGDESAFDFIADNFEEMPLTLAKVEMCKTYGEYLAKVTNATNFKKGVDQIVDVRNSIPGQARAQYDPVINGYLKAIADKKEAAGAKELADYVRSKLPKE